MQETKWGQIWSSSPYISPWFLRLEVVATQHWFELAISGRAIWQLAACWKHPQHIKSQSEWQPKINFNCVIWLMIEPSQMFSTKIDILRYRRQNYKGHVWIKIVLILNCILWHQSLISTQLQLQQLVIVGAPHHNDPPNNLFKKELNQVKLL